MLWKEQVVLHCDQSLCMRNNVVSVVRQINTTGSIKYHKRPKWKTQTSLVPSLIFTLILFIAFHFWPCCVCHWPRTCHSILELYCSKFIIYDIKMFSLQIIFYLTIDDRIIANNVLFKYCTKNWLNLRFVHHKSIVEQIIALKDINASQFLIYCHRYFDKIMQRKEERAR